MNISLDFTTDRQSEYNRQDTNRISLLQQYNPRKQISKKFHFYQNSQVNHSLDLTNQKLTLPKISESSQLDLEQSIRKPKGESFHEKNQSYGAFFTSRGVSLQQNNPEVKKYSKCSKNSFYSKSQEDNITFQYFLQKDKILNDILRQDFNQLFNDCKPLLEACIDQQLQFKFIDLLLFLAQFGFENEENAKSSFLFFQVVILSEIFQMNHKKLEALLGLAELSRKQVITINFKQRLGYYQVTIKVLKKSLQYSLVLNDQTKEILIYDLLGLNYFYLGQLKEANYFHQKFIKSDVEQSNSYNKANSEKFIGFYQKSLKYQSDNFDRVVLMKISLPIKNKYEEEGVLCDQYKIMKIDTCTEEQVFKTILAGKEFTEFDFEIYIENQWESQLDKSVKPMVYHTPKYILDLQHRIEMKNRHKYQIDKSVFKDLRDQEIKETPHEIFLKLNNQILSNLQVIGEKHDQILMRHLKREKDIKPQNKTKIKQLNTIFF